MPIPEPIKSALEGAGISASSLDRIRLTRGVVGKASYVATAALLVLGTIAVTLRPDAPILLALLAVFVFLAYFAGTLWFAHQHPGVALLEGAELIQWRQMEIAAKDTVLTPALTVNTESPPEIEHDPGDAIGR
jgi:hypothetical protein